MLALKQMGRGVDAACAVSLLVALLRSDQPAVQVATANALLLFACGSLLSINAIMVAGALPFLVT